MRKPTLIIGKKHVILACLTLILAIAVYINYAFAAADNSIIGSSDIAKTDKAVKTSSNEKADNYGDAEYVNSGSGLDYFSQARLSRMTSRDEAVEKLSAMLGGGDLSAEEDAAYTAQAVSLSKLSESESKIENLVKAQGFEDCVVYLDGGSANIVVRTDGLTAVDAARIKDILLGEVSVPAENIRIFEVK